MDQKQAAKHQVYEALKERMLAGEFPPGAMLSLRDLNARLGVPVAAIREAMWRLEHDGLVNIYPQRGLQVAPLDTHFVRDVFQLRRLLEREGLLICAKAPDRAALEQLRGRLAALVAGQLPAPDAAEEAAATDAALHDLFIAALDNALIQRVYNNNRDRLRVFRAVSRFPRGGTVAPAAAEHMQILDALLDGCTDAAVAALDGHLLSAMQRALGLGDHRTV